MSDIVPGWYKDPADPSTQRYWDGDGWVGAALPADAPPPEGPPPEPPPALPGPPAAAENTAPPPAGPPGFAPEGPLPPGTPYPFPPGFVPRPHGLPLAPYGHRLGARVIDIVVVAVLSAAANAWFVYQWILEVTPIVMQAIENPTGPTPAATPRSDYLELTILLITMAVWLAYEVPALAQSGQTLGKRMVGIKVVRVESLEPLGGGRAFRRWGRLGMWTPLWGLWGVGFIGQLIASATLLTDQPLRRSWGDKAAGTVVVQIPPRRRAGTADHPSASRQNSGGTR